MSVQPFQINIPEATLDDLKKRLAQTRLPDEVEGAGWDFGTNSGYLRSLLTYWQDQYDCGKTSMIGELRRRSSINFLSSAQILMA